MPPFPTVDSRDDVTFETLARAVAEAREPVIFKGLVKDWPVVQAARRGAGDLIDYLKGCDNGTPAVTFRKGGDGKYFYGDGLDGVNFQRASVPLSLTLERLRKLEPGSGEHIYIQSTPLKDHLPRLKADNRLPGVEAEPRIWIGNASVTQIHFDLYENLACMVGGSKRFVLFPPEQLPNLYIGPFETTVSGVPTAMADLENPDFATHPRFAGALRAATVAELEPGDVLYIPYMWWHHVVSDGHFNVQVNYWWNPAEAFGSPMQALILAMLAVRDLPPEQNAAWKTMFEHFVFHGNGPVAEHLPEGKRGLMGEMTVEQRVAIRKELGRNLAED